MGVRYYVDPDTGQPHTYGHGVDGSGGGGMDSGDASEDNACSGGSRQALGMTAHGRCLRVIYVPDEEGNGVFVVTAYPLTGKQLQAFRRRQRKRKR